jgi:hypothetical protein
MTKLPDSMKKLLWSVDVDNFDDEAYQAYLIHQVLRFGELADIKWLIKELGREAIKQVFLQSPQKVYSKPGFHFVSRSILGINEKLNESEYVQSFIDIFDADRKNVWHRLPL